LKHHSFAEAARHFNITRERARQLAQELGLRIESTIIDMLPTAAETAPPWSNAKEKLECMRAQAREKERAKMLRWIIKGLAAEGVIALPLQEPRAGGETPLLPQAHGADHRAEPSLEGRQPAPQESQDTEEGREAPFEPPQAEPQLAEEPKCRLSQLNDAFARLDALVRAHVPADRYQSLALTALEEAQMWAYKGINMERIAPGGEAFAGEKNGSQPPAGDALTVPPARDNRNELEEA